MAGVVYGLDFAEMCRRLRGSDAEESVVTHLITAAERGIMAGHAERMSQQPQPNNTVH